MSPPAQKLTLYTYFRSSASARVRTVMALHGIPREDIYIHLLKGDQSSDSYKEVNPSGTVPTLVIHREQGELVLSQCIAIMEYLDEVYGPASATGRLLPADAEARATVRSIVDLVVGDLFPMLTMGILNRVKSHGVDGPTWAKECCASILPALEGLLARTSATGRYAYGDAVTMADAALVPQIYTVLRFYPDISAFPTVKSVFDHCAALPAFVAADWRHQPDTPEEFRAK
ncbi:Maleylacetoacetate isomerase [Vanrija pseudolonga]|uniref:Maleylacetoacetate isomerase n=1 Tax=Vanrija pseudolonga TaxID=143232 RepID=A0AAF0Y2Z9_9TREE|nr:Maleylacetoacetate isomerase [Vanrija pseudolonga]